MNTKQAVARLTAIKDRVKGEMVAAMRKKTPPADAVTVAEAFMADIEALDMAIARVGAENEAVKA